MKKLFCFSIFVVSLIFVSNFGYSEVVFRATETTTADTDVSVATGVVRIYDITVASGAAAGATFRYFNSSDAVDTSGVYRSSSVIYDVNETEKYFRIDETLSQGFRYTTVGTSRIRVRWNWEGYPPPGQGQRGLK